MKQRRHLAAAPPRGATPRALAARSSSSSSRQQHYTAADIDREIAADSDDDDDDDDDNVDEDDSSNEDDDENDVSNDEYDEDDDDDDDDTRNKGSQAKGKRQLQPKATPKKRIRKSGYKPVSKKPKIVQKNSTKKSKRHAESSDENEEEEDDDDNDDDDDDDDESDEEFEEEENENSNEDEDEEDSDDDSDYGTSSKKTPTRGRKKGSRTNSGKGRTIRSSPRTTNNTRSSSARSSRRQSQRHLSNSASASSNDDDDSYEGTSGGGKGRGRPRRACKTQTELRMSEMVHKDMQSEKEAWGGVLEEDDRELLGLEGDASGDVDDDDEENQNDDDDDVEKEEVAESNKVTTTTATNSRRASPSKTRKKIGIHVDDDDEDYDDVPTDTNDGEDEDNDDEDEDDDLVSDDELISKQNQRRSSRNPRRTKNIDLSEEEIGTADEDSEDEETGPGILMSPARKSSASRIGGRSPIASRAMAHARMGREALDINENNDDDEAHQSATPHSTTNLSSRKESKDVRMASQINCPSTTDEITMANLPKNKPHVCYISPDGRTRHCFALETLYRIAISSTNNRIGGGIDDNTIGSPQKLTFLQPPHFRSPMEDDLLDQIASRFGRAALVIEKSAIYKRMHGSIFSLNDDDELDDFDEDGEFVGYGNTNHSTRRGNFQDRFERYIQSLMGSNDVYCCPLCYNEADRRLGNMGDEEMWEDDDDDDDDDDDAAEDGHKHSGEDCFSFMDDPMRILGSLDQDHYEVASTFCFRTLVDVKTHLKIVHQVNIKEVAGNDLYHRFQIRASDGLLQSWLKRNLGKTTVQGDMMRYWNQGENQSFVLLLSQIDKGMFEGEISGEYGSDFCQSFPNRARRIWREVSAPYLKDQHDMGDFIAEEGDEESDEDADEGPTKGNSSLTPQDTPGEEGGSLKSPEDQIIEFLQKKQKSKKQKQSFFKRKANDSSDNENSSDESSDDDELEVLPKPQQYEEVEDEDEWTKSKSLRAKKGQGKKSSRRSDEDSGDANVFDSDIEIDNPEVNGSGRKRIIDDDENSMGSGTVDGRPKHASPTNNGGSARKKVIESSDEESF